LGIRYTYYSTNPNNLSSWYNSICRFEKGFELTDQKILTILLVLKTGNIL